MHDVAVKPLTSVVFTVVLYVRFIELYALTAFQSLPFAFLVHEDTKPIGVGFFKSHARTSANAVCLPFALWGWWRPKGLKPERYLGYMLRQRFGPRVYLLESYVPARFPGKPSLKEKSHSRVRGKERASPCLMSKNDKTIKSSGLRHGKMTGTSRSKNRRIPRSSKELIGYDSMLSNGIAYLGGDRWSVSLRISDINYQVATQDQQLDVVDRWGRFLELGGQEHGRADHGRHAHAGSRGGDAQHPPCPCRAMRWMDCAGTSTAMCAGVSPAVRPGRVNPRGRPTLSVVVPPMRGGCRARRPRARGSPANSHRPRPRP